MEMPVEMVAVFKAERDAGLEQVIRVNARVLLASVVRSVGGMTIAESALARLPERAQAAGGDFDLHPLTTILATVGWNKNDDVFDPVETWLARHSPEDKQLNYEHDDSQIVGHITSNWVIGEDGAVVADDLAVEDLPAKSTS